MVVFCDIDAILGFLETLLINDFNFQISLVGIDESRLVAGLYLSFGY